MEIIPSPIPVLLLVLPFLVTYAALHVILFRPLMQYLDEREAVSGDALAEAGSFEQAATDKLDTVQEQIATARREMAELRKSARGEAREREAEILEEARVQGRATVDEAVVQIRKEKKAAATTLKGTARILSADIAAQVLGRSAKEA